MNIESCKPPISDYSFLRLFVSLITWKVESPIIYNHQLEKNLYEYYNRPEYHFLFEDIIKRENYLDLNRAFLTSYAFGLLTQLRESSNSIRSVINITPDEAKLIQSEYSEEIVEAMTNLYNEYSQNKNKDSEYKLKRKKTNFC